MPNVLVDANDRRRVLDAFFAWHTAQDESKIVSLPPESAGPENRIVFSKVPTAFLAVLDHEGIQYETQ